LREADPQAATAQRLHDGRALRLTFPVSVAPLPWAQAQLACFLRQEGRQAPAIIGRAELLLEELVTNVVQHGGVADPAAQLSLLATLGPDRSCHLVFEDPGAPFDPVEAAVPARPSCLEEARIGGLGLVLLQRMARDLMHERLPEGRNRLSFRLA
jgi:anti-sigma regulatory factor (Ser/Thr protein kinase)